MIYTLEELRNKVGEAVQSYNANAPADEPIVKVGLFGSYSEGKATEHSDVDLLVSFSSAVVSLFTLAKVLTAMQESLGAEVDVLQDPLPQDALLEVKRVIPL